MGGGGLRRTFHCVTRVLNLLYSLVCTSSNLNVCCCDISHHRCVYSPRGFLSECYVASGGSYYIGVIRVLVSFLKNFSRPELSGCIRILRSIKHLQTVVAASVTSSSSYKSVLHSYYFCYSKCLPYVNTYTLDTLSIILVH